jgi:hypothetical protein
MSLPVLSVSCVNEGLFQAWTTVFNFQTVSDLLFYCAKVNNL